MEKRLKNYLQYLSRRLTDTLSNEEKDKLQKELLIQIGFFQHERLIHLIVTVLFALLTGITALCGFFVANPVLLTLFFALLILLIPYIRHYYILENGVQKLYTYYDQLSE